MPAILAKPKAGWLQAGFTLVELVMVMVVIGILATVAASRMTERESFDARALADQSQTMLHYAQKLAVAQNRPVYVRLDGSSIALCFNNTTCASANRVIQPLGNNSGNNVTKAACANDSSWYCEGVPSPLTLVTTPSVSGFYFDALGKPYALNDIWPSRSSSFSTLTLTVQSAQPGAATSIKIEAESGYVH